MVEPRGIEPYNKVRKSVAALGDLIFRGQFRGQFAF